MSSNKRSIWEHTKMGLKKHEEKNKSYIKNKTWAVIFDHATHSELTFLSAYLATTFPTNEDYI